MKNPVLNVELLDLVIKTIKADPTKWNQGYYRTIPNRAKPEQQQDGRLVYAINCRTAFCVAGWAVQLGSENTPAWTDSSTIVANEHDDPEEVSEGTIFASARAKRLLGLDEYQADELFNGDNSLDEIERVVDQIKEEDSP